MEYSILFVCNIYYKRVQFKRNNERCTQHVCHWKVRNFCQCTPLKLESSQEP